MFNLLKTAVLMAAITALFMAVGAFIGGQRGMMIALARRRRPQLLQLLVLRQAGAEDVQRAGGRRDLGAAVLFA